MSHIGHLGRWTLRVLCIVLTLRLGFCAVPASASPNIQDSCVVRGRLLTASGRPVRAGFVRIYGPGSIGRRTLTKADGTFLTSVPHPGGYHIACAAVHHKTVFLPLLVAQPGVIGIAVKLGAPSFKVSPDTLSLIGDFNGFRLDGAIPLQSSAASAFKAVVPVSGDTLHYQVVGASDDRTPLAGTMADTFILDRRQPLIDNHLASFISLVITHRDSAVVVFNMDDLPKGATDAVVAFDDSLSQAARLAAIRQDFNKRERRVLDAYAAYRAAGGASDSFHWDSPVDLHDIDRAVAQERDPLLRAYMLLGYTHFAPSGIDTEHARRILTELTPDSPLWSLEWGGPERTFYNIARSLGDPVAARRYAERVVACSPDSTVRAAFLYFLSYDAHLRGANDELGRYFTRLEGEFPRSLYAERGRREFAPNRVIAVGRDVPDFRFRHLSDSTRAYTKQDFEGKFVLIDFWATWCGPCLGELPYLDRAYRLFGGRGLAILSVSFDQTARDVERLRTARWPMPWLHAWQVGGFSSDAARAFEIVGIPRPILVGPQGKILAVDEDLRGERLERTLARFMEPQLRHDRRKSEHSPRLRPRTKA